MSSKRGRKRNDNLPPNRARDVQRAFRARRAAHLQALEERVAELEDENNTLRAALNLPPANRPALGKGPTGKDKPKSYAPRAPPAISTEPIASTSSLSANTAMSSSMAMGSTSRTESPSSASTRTHSLSPSSIAAVLNNPQSQPVVSVDTSWEEGLFGGRDRTDVQPSPISTSYPVTPVSAAASQVPFPFTTSSSAPRPTQFAMSMAQNFPHTADRPMGDVAYADALFNRRFSFSQPNFPTAHDTSRARQLHAQSPTSAVPPIPQQRAAANMPSPLTYAHRRSITEPQALCNVLMSEAQQMQQQHAGARVPSPTGMSEGMGQLRAAEFMDSRVGRMPS